MQRTILHWNNHRHHEIHFCWNYKEIMIWRTFIQKTDMFGSWGSVRSSRWTRRAVTINASLFFYSPWNLSKATVKIPLALKPSILLLPCKPDDCLKSQNKLLKQLSKTGWYSVLELLGLSYWKWAFCKYLWKGNKSK